MVVVLLGPPGAGKGTQAQLVADYYNLKLISMGEFLRSESKQTSEIGKKVSFYLREGELVPDEIIIEIIEKMIGDAATGIVLDGFPRNINQAKKLIEIIGRVRGTKIIVIDLAATDEQLIERLSARRQCPECSKIYNLKTKPPKNDELCDLCAVKLYQRDDDHIDIIEKRLNVYHEWTKPIINYYKEISIYNCVSINGDISQVFREIREIIDANCS